MKLVLGAVLVIGAIFGICDGAKILCVFNLHSYSHFILGKVLSEELASRGHQVTIVSTNKIEENIPNLKNVHLDGALEYLQAKLGNSTMSPNDLLSMPTTVMYFFIAKFGLLVNDFTFSHKNFQKHLEENHTYDLVIAEHFYTDSIKILCHHYRAPCVALSTIGSNPSINYLVGNPASPSFIPDFLLPYGSEMNLFQRANNFIYQTFVTVTRELYFTPQHQALAKKYFPDAPDIYEIFGNTSLVLLNSHFGITQPIPHVPNMVEIGGMHIKLKNKIPADIKKFLDEAKDGVIYFSFGSNLKSSELTLELRQDLLKTFAGLKQRILWKFESDKLENLPKNVMVSKWLPQPDILAHHNVKIFVTHGGLLSVTEATYFGVPVIGIPFFGDQPMNMAEVERIGIGIKIEFNNLNADSLTKAINEMLTNKKYSETMKKRSAIFKDRPLSPMETAVYWIEYVLRHKGGLHMQSSSVKLRWYQYYMIDVMALISLVATISFYFIYLLFRTLVKKLCSKKNNVKNTKKTN